MGQALLGKRRYLVIAAAVAAVLLLAAVYGRPALAHDADRPNTGIWVTGQGSASGAPDVAVLDLGVEVIADSAADARTEAAEGIEAAIAALEESGVAEEDIQTQHFSIRPRYDYVETTNCVNADGEAVEPTTTGEVPPGAQQCTRSRERVLQGYQVNNHLTVKIRELDSVGEVIDSVIEAAGDIVRINGINFLLEDSEALENEARAAAVADLKGKAAMLAELAGVELGSLVYLSESVGPQPFPRFEAEFAMLSLDSAVTSVRSGELEVVVTVVGVFEIAEPES